MFSSILLELLDNPEKITEMINEMGLDEAVNAFSEILKGAVPTEDMRVEVRKKPEHKRVPHHMPFELDKLELPCPPGCPIKIENLTINVNMPGSIGEMKPCRSHHKKHHRHGMHRRRKSRKNRRPEKKNLKVFDAMGGDHLTKKKTV